jgi:DNA-binding NarL/FixJ family response regulator
MKSVYLYPLENNGGWRLVLMKIVVIDNKAFTRKTIKQILSAQIDFDVAGVGRDIYDAIRLTESRRPDVVLIERDLPGLDGISVAEAVRSRRPSASVILLADSIDDETILSAFSRGISGLLPYASLFEDLSRAVRCVSGGNYYMNRAVMLKVLRLFSSFAGKLAESGGQSGVSEGGSLRKLTRSELCVAALLGRGFSNRQTAEALGVTERTVRNYVSSIMKKTGLANRAQIALCARDNGLVSAKTAAAGLLEKRPPKDATLKSRNVI